MQTAKIIILLMVMLVILAVGYKIVAKIPPIRITATPINYVRVEGYFQYLTKDDIKNALMPQISAGFWEADVQSIQRAVTTLPWVETASVERIWPDALGIKVMEKIPYSRWGAKQLITESGQIFTPNDLTPFKQMTVIDGSKQQSAQILAMMQGIKTTLEDQSLGLAEFTVNQRGAWQIKLTNGLQIKLGRNGQLKKLQRFLKTLTVLEQTQITAMAVADLRYPNGYAVVWKPETIETTIQPDNLTKSLATP